MTRFRIDSFSHVRVIAEMNDDSLHMISRFVIASGGCSVPPQREANAENSKPRIKVRMTKTAIDQTIKAQIMINHPNASGLQFDQKTGEYIPAHYVTNINVNYNNEMLISAEMGISISENPSIGFSFKPEETGILETNITDSKNQEFVSNNKLEF